VGPDESSQDAWSFYLGLWGAVLSTGLAALKIIEHWRDRGHLHLELAWEQPDRKAGDIPFRKGGELQLLPKFIVTNVGRRTVTVVGVGAWRGVWRPRNVVQTKHLPYNLEESERVKDQVPKAWLEDTSVKSLFVRDSHNRDWFISRLRFWGFRREGRRVNQPPEETAT
jgi:hypothetical protein